MSEGWLCPRCGHVLAPFVPECTCPPTSMGAATVVFPAPCFLPNNYVPTRGCDGKHHLHPKEER